MLLPLKLFSVQITFLQLITSVDTRELRLTKIDNELYEKFRKEFPDMDVSVINENELKSPEGKKVCAFFYSYTLTCKDL